MFTILMFEIGLISNRYLIVEKQHVLESNCLFELDKVIIVCVCWNDKVSK